MEGAAHRPCYSGRGMARRVSHGIALAAAIVCAVFPASPADGTLRSSALAAHNAIREKLGLPALEWSDKLAGAAQNWATTLLMQGVFVHRPDNAYGENLFEIRGGGTEAAAVVKAWAAEASQYDLRRNRCRGVCGHYTQIVWKDTLQVGCAVARSSFREVWVCNYYPAGNVTGRRPY
jgi:pathogenesis-related protein 1